MANLTENDLQYLINFVEEVLVTIKNDDIGTTHDLEDLALNAGQILGLSLAHMRSIE